MIKKDYYELLFNFTNLKIENDELKKLVGSESKSQSIFEYEDIKEIKTNITSNSTRPQTATIKKSNVDKLFESTIENLKLFNQNPFFDEDDLLDKYKMDVEENENNKEIQEDKSEERSEDSDPELEDLINKSLTDFKEIKELNKKINQEIEKNKIISSNLEKAEILDSGYLFKPKPKITENKNDMTGLFKVNTNSKVDFKIKSSNKLNKDFPLNSDKSSKPKSNNYNNSNISKLSHISEISKKKQLPPLKK